LNFTRDLRSKLLLLAVFLSFIIFGVDDYPIIQMLVKIICTSCVGLE